LIWDRAAPDSVGSGGHVPAELNRTAYARAGQPNQLRPGERCRLVLHPTQHISVLGLLDDVSSWPADGVIRPMAVPSAAVSDAVSTCSLLEKNTFLPKDHVCSYHDQPLGNSLVADAPHLGEF
jgi:hypothetical protein